MTIKQRKPTSLRGPVPLSHLFLRQFLMPGDCAVDATCGNGNDTLLLAEQVGRNGTVWAFDVQHEAVKNTRAKLSAAGLSEQVLLLNAGHENIAHYIDKPVNAVVFNLGYLPGGDRTVITRPETTVAALKLSLTLLAPGGVVSIAVYPGHHCGGYERDAVESWAGGLSNKEFHVWRMGQINVAAEAPFLILIQKAAR